MQLVEGIHFERVELEQGCFVYRDDGSRLGFCCVAADGRAVLLIQTHPDAGDSELREAGQAIHQAKKLEKAKKRNGGGRV